LVRQLEIVLKVPRFRLEQPVIELAQLLIQMRHQHGETLTGACLDKGTDHQRISQPVRLMIAYEFAQAGCIA